LISVVSNLANFYTIKLLIEAGSQIQAAI